MNKISIKRLGLKGFRSFIDEQFTDSLPDNGILGIKGFDSQNNTSSGVGKTSFHFAIAYALGFCPLPSTELQSWPWLTDNKLQVTLELDTYKGPVVIKRGEETSITINDEKSNGSIKTNEKIKELFGIPLDLIETLTFREQKKPGRFLSMSDSQKKEFLSKLLDLGQLENQIEEYTKKANKLKEELDKIKAVIETLDLEYKALDEPILESDEVLLLDFKNLKNLIYEKNIELEYVKGRIEGFDEQTEVMIATLINEYKDIIKNISNQDILLKENQIAELNNSIIEAKAEDKRYKDRIANLILVNNSTINEYKKSISLENSISIDIDKIKNKIEGIQNQVCNTCKQTWIEDKNIILGLKNEKEKLEVQLIKIDQYKCIVKELNSQNEKYSLELIENKKVSSLMEDFNNQKHELALLKIKKNSQITEIQNEFNTKKFSLAKDRANDKEYIKNIQLKSSLENELLSADKQLQNIEYNIKTIQNNNKLKLDLHKQYLDKNKQIKNKVDSLTEKYKTIFNEYKTESDYVDLLKSFLGVIFEEVLNEIALESNEILKHMQNVSNVTLDFTTERITQKGTTKQEIKPVITRNGNTVSLRSLSGGQGTAVELAVDLALGKVIGRRKGIFLGWIVLDESFDGLDLPVRESCLELLKVAAQDRLIFVIDHFTEVKEYFDKIINIEYNNDISYLRNYDI